MNVKYGPVVAKHVGNPRNLGKLDNPDGVGHIDDPTTETLLTIYVRIADGSGGGRVATEVRFRAFGCSGCIATGSIATELAQGRTLDEIRAVDATAISRALDDGLPEEQRYCADLAAEALHRAIEAAGR
jgi:nitrogen fixation protein NifU and related proteins